MSKKKTAVKAGQDAAKARGQVAANRRRAAQSAQNGLPAPVRDVSVHVLVMTGSGKKAMRRFATAGAYNDYLFGGSKAV